MPDTLRALIERATVRDATIRRLEDRLRETHQLELAGRLTKGVAHDLNTQLTALMGYADLTLADPDLPPRVETDIREILLAAERMAELTGQLLAFSRTQPLAPRAVGLDAIVSATRAARTRLVGRDVELVDEPMPGLAAVHADPERLVQALLDIVANAGEAMPDGGRVTTAGAIAVEDGSLSHVPAGRYVRFAITDTGAGMDAETRVHAFEPFFTTKAGHTGLGLWALYGFVGQTGGHVTVDSEPGAGTTVALYLPLA